jgi:hypothetical protein
MPRKAPDGKGVTEHRITLGNYERDQLKEIREQMSTLSLAKTAGNIIGGAGLGLGVAAIGYVVWKAYDNFTGAFGDDPIDIASNLFEVSLVGQEVSNWETENIEQFDAAIEAAERNRDYWHNISLTDETCIAYRQSLASKFDAFFVPTPIAEYAKWSARVEELKASRDRYLDESAKVKAGIKETLDPTRIGLPNWAKSYGHFWRGIIGGRYGSNR